LRPIYDERGTFLGNKVVPVGWHAKGPQDGKDWTADLVRKALTPAPVDSIEEWLAELSVITARRAEDEFTGALRVDAYSRRLGAYPADVVKAALFNSRWKFLADMGGTGRVLRQGGCEEDRSGVCAGRQR